jgi:Cu-processing system permease protein
MYRIVNQVFWDILRNRMVLVYSLTLLFFCWGGFWMEDGYEKGILTVYSIILLIVPLFSLLFSCIYLYNSSEFIELLVSQPVNRTRVWGGLYIGMAISFLLAFFLSAGVAFFVFCDWGDFITLFLGGIFLSLIFLSIGFWVAVISRDKARGIGMAIITWLFFAMLYDGLILFLMFQLSEYPIEKYTLVAVFFSPIDITRILLLLQMDASAMLGYAGAVFKSFFGNGPGILISYGVQVVWIIIPLWLSFRIFLKRDL